MAQGDPVHLVDGSASGAEGEQEPPRQDGRAGSMEPDLVTYRSLLYRAAHAQRALMHPFMASIGLGTGQPRLLSYLDRFGACSQRELADYFELDPAGVSRALDALRRKGFVTFETNAEDRRAKVVRLTGEGKRVAQSWDAACREEAAAMLKGFSSEERTAFADFLARARDNLRAYERELADARSMSSERGAGRVLDDVAAARDAARVREGGHA